MSVALLLKVLFFSGQVHHCRLWLVLFKMDQPKHYAKTPNNESPMPEGTTPLLRRRHHQEEDPGQQQPSTLSPGQSPTSGQTNSPKPSRPTVVLDGSKLILRLGKTSLTLMNAVFVGKNDTFTIDNPCKILLATPKIRIERPVAWQTQGTCTEAENTVRHGSIL